MEHAVPEQFWVDKSQCRCTNEQGQIQNPSQADCAQGVSAVKAIAIAKAEGQRIYTINQSNAATALPKLPVGGTVGHEIQSAIQVGKEVTFHERGINAHGFSGGAIDEHDGTNGFVQTRRALVPRKSGAAEHAVGPAFDHDVLGGGAVGGDVGGGMGGHGNAPG